MPDKNKPKTEDYYKDAKPELIQVYDSCSMPHKFGTEETSILVAGQDGAGNDTYHRWYPDRVEKKEIGKYEHFKNEKELEAGQLLNNWLIEHGLEWDKENKYFYVLIYVSW